jgi:prepilin-type processing-associated H-X9-DG protein
MQIYLEDSNGVYPPFDLTPQIHNLPLWQMYMLYATGDTTKDKLGTLDITDLPINRERFHCPSDSNDTYNNLASDWAYWFSYGGNANLGSSLGGCALTVNDVADPSRVMLLMDTLCYGGWHCINVWAPQDIVELWQGKRHSDGDAFNVLFCDGRVETQADNLDGSMIWPL